nr:LytTR family DNA-binding domain-containing protein [Solibacillus isronensis]
MSELEKRLHHFRFFRCHRSYIVNLHKAREILTWTCNSYSLSL